MKGGAWYHSGAGPPQTGQHRVRRRKKKPRKKKPLEERWWPQKYEGMWDEYIADCEWRSQEYDVTVSEVDAEKCWKEWCILKERLRESRCDFVWTRNKLDEGLPGMFRRRYNARSQFERERSEIAELLRIKQHKKRREVE